MKLWPSVNTSTPYTVLSAAINPIIIVIGRAGRLFAVRDSKRISRKEVKMEDLLSPEERLIATALRALLEELEKMRIATEMILEELRRR